MSQRKKRINIINLLYRHFLMNYPINQTKQEAYELFQTINNDDSYKKIEILLDNLSKIIDTFDNNLKIGWEFSRLSNFHKAILTYAIFENKYLNVSKKIVINEALEIAKKYGENSEIKYINKVLDNILN